MHVKKSICKDLNHERDWCGLCTAISDALIVLYIFLPVMISVFCILIGDILVTFSLVLVGNFFKSPDITGLKWVPALCQIMVTSVLLYSVSAFGVMGVIKICPRFCKWVKSYSFWFDLAELFLWLVTGYILTTYFSSSEYPFGKFWDQILY